ncbi:baculoviral IAP repeat-containing protein 5 isoform X2 [Zootermopsis nevadensis]|uniref:baculoviral IAP repeat-containing protein 5 isoform X2 n=1 Tax=Zootermopsis nevadensis TaxID=136037 RepID=UPI000B8EBA6E|nr:baculoviral IAP repeat-containing protein 5 isoform X2 [Zootermopsis nevadensis]
MVASVTSLDFQNEQEINRAIETIHITNMMEVPDLATYMLEDERLGTFKSWPFNEDTSCNARKMAEAGYIFCGSKDEPDLVQCQVCLKKLDGWKQDDDPWNEHKTHSSSCLFVKIGKKDADLTVYNHFDLSLERTKNIMKAEHAEQRAAFIEKAEESKQLLQYVRSSQTFHTSLLPYRQGDRNSKVLPDYTAIQHRRQLSSYILLINR